jgi:hypothetical protein
MTSLPPPRQVLGFQSEEILERLPAINYEQRIGWLFERSHLISRYNIPDECPVLTIYICTEPPFSGNALAHLIRLIDVSENANDIPKLFRLCKIKLSGRRLKLYNAPNWTDISIYGTGPYACSFHALATCSIIPTRRWIGLRIQTREPISFLIPYPSIQKTFDSLKYELHTQSSKEIITELSLLPDTERLRGIRAWITWCSL